MRCVAAGLSGYVVYSTQELKSGLLPISYLSDLSADFQVEGAEPPRSYPLPQTKCIRPGMSQPGFNMSIINDETVSMGAPKHVQRPPLY